MYHQRDVKCTIENGVSLGYSTRTNSGGMFTSFVFKLLLVSKQVQCVDPSPPGP